MTPSNPATDEQLSIPNSPSGIRTMVFRLTVGDTNHCTNGDMYVTSKKNDSNSFFI